HPQIGVPVHAAVAHPDAVGDGSEADFQRPTEQAPGEEAADHAQTMRILFRTGICQRPDAAALSATTTTRPEALRSHCAGQATRSSRPFRARARTGAFFAPLTCRTTVRAVTSRNGVSVSRATFGS